MSKLNELIKLAAYAVEKAAFVDAASAGGAPPPGGDPAAMGMDPAAMGGDPAAMGMDPAAMGMDPAAMGGAPPPAPGMDPAAIQQMVTQAVQQAMGSTGGGGQAGPAGAAMKPKIDVNVEIMQIKNMIAKLCDAMGVHIPAQDMVATPDKLLAMSQGQSTTSAPPQGGGSAIAPIAPMQGASPAMAGAGGEKQSYMTSVTDMGNKAAALATVISQRNRAS